MASGTQELPTITVGQDYDGYFEELVMGWVREKADSGRPFKSTNIVITAGPWRPYAVVSNRVEDALHLDFYSALRTGLGMLPEYDVERIKELL